MEAYLLGKEEDCPECEGPLEIEERRRPVLGSSGSERFYVECADCGSKGQWEGGLDLEPGAGEHRCRLSYKGEFP